MRKETIERKKARSKKKDQINKVKKDLGISKNLSSIEQNKLILSEMQQKKNKESTEIEITEDSFKSAVTMRSEYKCSCGKLVVIESDDPKMHRSNKCSACR